MALIVTTGTKPFKMTSHGCANVGEQLLLCTVRARSERRDRFAEKAHGCPPLFVRWS